MVLQKHIQVSYEFPDSAAAAAFSVTVTVFPSAATHVAFCALISAVVVVFVSGAAATIDILVSPDPAFAPPP
jgi:hypothetical protein